MTINTVETPRVHLASLGCAKNLVDSERLLGALGEAGAIVGAEAEEADIIIVNTCGFIDTAKEESIDTILDLAEMKNSGACRRLFVMGCLAQRYREELKKEMPEVDAFFGLGEQDAVVAACGLSAEGHETARLLLTPKHSAYQRIADGCDNRCSYCAIPIIRGPFHSRPSRDIIDEARRLVDSGAHEINLIGQDTTLYGTDMPGEPPIHELIASLADIPRLRWIRLLYTHPAHFTRDLIDAYELIDKLCPYVDLPLQHLNDVILARMGRRVTQAKILDLIERLRSGVPDIAIRTAFIVGFPGETREQFNEMLSLAERIEFDHLGAFAYSREEDTPAAKMRGQVSEKAKSRRLRDIMSAQQRIAFGKNRGMIGRTFEAVIDAPADEPGAWVARSRSQAPDVDSVIRLTGKGLSPGMFLDVKITGSCDYDLTAEPAGRVN